MTRSLQRWIFWKRTNQGPHRCSSLSRNRRWKDLFWGLWGFVLDERFWPLSRGRWPELCHLQGSIVGERFQKFDCKSGNGLRSSSVCRPKLRSVGWNVEVDDFENSFLMSSTTVELMWRWSCKRGVFGFLFMWNSWNMIWFCLTLLGLLKMRSRRLRRGFGSHCRSWTFEGLGNFVAKKYIVYFDIIDWISLCFWNLLLNEEKLPESWKFQVRFDNRGLGAIRPFQLYLLCK